MFKVLIGRASSNWRLLNEVNKRGYLGVRPNSSLQTGIQGSESDSLRTKPLSSLLRGTIVELDALLSVVKNRHQRNIQLKRKKPMKVPVPKTTWAPSY